MGLLDKAKDKARYFKDETSGALADVAVAKLPGKARRARETGARGLTERPIIRRKAA